jgi:hypothetical protein
MSRACLPLLLVVSAATTLCVCAGCGRRPLAAGLGPGNGSPDGGGATDSGVYSPGTPVDGGGCSTDGGRTALGPSPAGSTQHFKFFWQINRWPDIGILTCDQAGATAVEADLDCVPFVFPCSATTAETSVVAPATYALVTKLLAADGTILSSTGPASVPLSENEAAYIPILYEVKLDDADAGGQFRD